MLDNEIIKFVFFICYLFFITKRNVAPITSVVCKRRA